MFSSCIVSCRGDSGLGEGDAGVLVGGGGGSGCCGSTSAYSEMSPKESCTLECASEDSDVREDSEEG